MRFRTTSGNSAVLSAVIVGNRGVINCQWDKRPTAADKRELDQALGAPGAIHVWVDDPQRGVELAVRFLASGECSEVLQ